MRKLNLPVKLDLNRAQWGALGVVCALLVVCGVAIATALQSWTEATQALGERRDQLAALRSRVGAVARQRKTQATAAPPQAFLDATTSGLATAQFQAYLSQLIVDQRAMLVSSGIQPAERDDKSDAIRLQVALTATGPALQELLYQLESGTPYVFVDSLSMQPGGSSERNAADPVLKVTLTVHAFWRRPSA